MILERGLAPLNRGQEYRLGSRKLVTRTVGERPLPSKHEADTWSLTTWRHNPLCSSSRDRLQLLLKIRARSHDQGCAVLKYCAPSVL